MQLGLKLNGTRKVIIIKLCFMMLYCYSFGQGLKSLDEISGTANERKLLSHKTGIPDSLKLMAFMMYDSTITDQDYRLRRSKLQKLIQKLTSHKPRFKKDTRFIKYAFNEVRACYLNVYEKYVPFNETVVHKKFNCLTGTALYAYIFSALGYQTTIYETHFHCFLTIHLENETNALVDAADKVYGLIVGKKQIEGRILHYQRTESDIAADENMFPVNKYPKIKPVTEQELAGLQYFNFAVVDFNSCDYKKAYINLLKAYRLYPSSERIKDLISYIDREKLDMLPKHFSITGN